MVLGHRIAGALLIWGGVVWLVVFSGQGAAFVDIPSAVLVATIVVGGLLFVFGPRVPAQALASVFRADAHKVDARHRAAMNLGYQLAWGAGVVGLLIGIIAATASTTDPRVFSGTLGIALCGVLYGGILAELVFNPVRHVLAHHVEAGDGAERGPQPKTSATKWIALVLLGWAFTGLFATALHSEREVNRARQELMEAILSVVDTPDHAPGEAERLLYRIDRIELHTGQ